MNPERWVKLGVIGVAGIGAACLGGLGLASYALGSGATVVAVDSSPAYAATRPVLGDGDVAAQPETMVTSDSFASSPPVPDIAPAVYSPPAEVPEDDVALDMDDVPPPVSLLPDDDTLEDAAASGDTARTTDAALEH